MQQAINSPVQVADELIGLMQRHGGAEYAGEPVSQLEHMLQAAHLAAAEGYDDDVVLGALFHDIGHICVAAGADNDMEGFGIRDHEEIGADFLKLKGFGKKVIRLVESHVTAKRYLTYKFTEYYGRLSDASKKTLELQGGPMIKEEAEAFEQYPLFGLIIKMRNWDDEAKSTDVAVPAIESYRSMIVDHLERERNRRV
jgi:2-amino-1-hydroxyethylphosphonate dioxygenase (glycine-forming)